MRKILCILLILALSGNILGCSTLSDSNTKEISFYYVRNIIDYDSASPVLTKTQLIFPQNEGYEEILQEYLRSSATNDYAPPFPKGTELLALNVENNQAIITLTHQLFTLSESRQIIAFACIAKTVISITGQNDVQIIIANTDQTAFATYNFSTDSFTFLDSFTVDDLDKA